MPGAYPTFCCRNHWESAMSARQILLFALIALSSAAWAEPACPALLNRQFLRLQDEKPQSLCQHADKVVLVVNTASFCGFTPQYRVLEALNARYADKGLVVLGFPSNDFGSQEPGTNKEIAEFCEGTFKVRFPMFTKSHVKASAGAELNPLFADLAQRTGSSPRWNFHKYLISRDGQTVQSFGSMVDPESKSFIQTVEQLLANKAK